MPKKKRELAGRRTIRKTFHLETELVNRWDCAVAACRGAPEYLTSRSAAEPALWAVVRRLERKHNHGKPFPPAKLPKGAPARPLKKRR